jgi:hypothetical protein
VLLLNHISPVGAESLYSRNSHSHSLSLALDLTQIPLPIFCNKHSLPGIEEDLNFQTFSIRVSTQIFREHLLTSGPDI